MSEDVPSYLEQVQLARRGAAACHRTLYAAFPAAHPSQPRWQDGDISQDLEQKLAAEGYIIERAFARSGVCQLAPEELSESDKQVAIAQAVEFAEYVERQAKGAMVDAARRFLSLPYAQALAKRIQPEVPS